MSVVLNDFKNANDIEASGVDVIVTRPVAREYGLEHEESFKIEEWEKLKIEFRNIFYLELVMRI